MEQSDAQQTWWVLCTVLTLSSSPPPEGASPRDPRLPEVSMLPIACLSDGFGAGAVSAGTEAGTDGSSARWPEAAAGLLVPASGVFLMRPVRCFVVRWLRVLGGADAGVWFGRECDLVLLAGGSKSSTCLSSLSLRFWLFLVSI